MRTAISDNDLATNPYTSWYRRTKAIRTGIITAAMAGSMFATGIGAAGAAPLNEEPKPAAPTESVAAVDNLELIRQLDAAGIEKRIEILDGTTVHFYTNQGMTLAVPEVDPDRVQPRIGGGFDWRGPYVSLNQSEQYYYVGIGATAAAAAISAAFIPAAPFAAAAAWALITYVDRNGACPGEMRVYIPNATPRCV
ncbi:MAG: hypothetical protein U5O16_02295 [Rhodococcus sp. (in: high G+C Gram-positive bacteria)]|uniref:hypothetical protein n=1 Tax=Rhodococcus sp. TaxID=1831 RepID=UPI002ADBF888|nr:hypothetical protein [Rhodococcus sp. (in: high G+C Gram-positive bacteria)]